MHEKLIRVLQRFSLVKGLKPIKKVYADNGYFGENNRQFLSLNKIADGIMRKAVSGIDLTEHEKE
jgi:IS5 family transposase